MMQKGILGAKQFVVYVSLWLWVVYICKQNPGIVGFLNMRHSNSTSKLTIQKVNFLIWHQLTHRYILMLRPWHCHSTSCHRKLFIGRYNRSCSRGAVITCKLNKPYHSVPFEWKVIFEDTVYTTDLESQFGRCRYWCARREFSQQPQRHML